MSTVTPTTPRIEPGGVGHDHRERVSSEGPDLQNGPYVAAREKNQEAGELPGDLPEPAGNAIAVHLVDVVEPAGVAGEPGRADQAGQPIYVAQLLRARGQDAVEGGGESAVAAPFRRAHPEASGTSDHAGKDAHPVTGRSGRAGDGGGRG